MKYVRKPERVIAWCFADVLLILDFLRLRCPGCQKQCHRKNNRERTNGTHETSDVQRSDTLTAAAYHAEPKRDDNGRLESKCYAERNQIQAVEVDVRTVDVVHAIAAIKVDAVGGPLLDGEKAIGFCCIARKP